MTAAAATPARRRRTPLETWIRRYWSGSLQDLAAAVHVSRMGLWKLLAGTHANPPHALLGLIVSRCAPRSGAEHRERMRTEILQAWTTTARRAARGRR